MIIIIEELVRDTANESVTSMENIRALHEIQIQHEQMFTLFKVKP